MKYQDIEVVSKKWDKCSTNCQYYWQFFCMKYKEGIKRQNRRKKCKDDTVIRDKEYSINLPIFVTVDLEDKDKCSSSCRFLISKEIPEDHFHSEHTEYECGLFYRDSWDWEPKRCLRCKELTEGK